MYDSREKGYLDWQSSIADAREEGLEKGREKGREEGLEKGEIKLIRTLQDILNIHPNITPASLSLASPLVDVSFESIESQTTYFTSSAVPTLETTTVTEVALGYHRNQQYSITAMTTSTGAVAERYAYTAYGQPTILNANGTVLTSSAVGNRYTYTGREWGET